MCSPYAATFRTWEEIGMKSTSLPESIIHKLKSDEDLEIALNSIYKPLLKKMLKNKLLMRLVKKI